MESNRLMLFCEPCAYKQIIEKDNSEDLRTIPTSPIPLGYLKKTKEKEKQQPKKTKCPKCGRGVALKTLPEAYSKAYEEIEKKEKEKKIEEEKFKRIKDGTPIKVNQSEFLG